ncbi:hypothetical protein [Estrella lausannensis]|uniref:Uncharacterized protein n=1 Tax=Estrella lausannensis TaxID=483423 RepID=A0A0H5DPB9_9BACT|nr:hypothetical protein [Estrella lausannensis]CRX38252.1 hypothetical protein ELAC_0903 [Estrella lausannensis]
MFSFPNISSFFKRGAKDAESPAPQNREEQSPVEEVARSVEEASEAALQIQAAPSDLTDREILLLENDLAMQMLKQYNSFHSEEEKRSALQMASLAGLMYQHIDNLERVQPFFDTPLELLPTPDQMGIKLPTGLAVQAFRDGSQIIIAMRGTELNQDSATMAANLIADMGIGRHKTNEDLIGSINAVRERVLDLYNYNIPPEQFNFLAALITSRAIGDDDKARMLSTAAKVGKESAKSGALGGLGGMVLGASVLIVSAPAAAIAASRRDRCTSGGINRHDVRSNQRGRVQCHGDHYTRGWLPDYR